MKFKLISILISFNILAFDNLKDAQNYLKFQNRSLDFNKFKNLLEHVYLNRSINGYYGDFINKITPLGNFKFIIFGNLRSSFSSFLSALNFLFKKDIIDNKFKIISPGFFIVIMGVFSGQDYNLATLTLVLKLIQKNPNSVFYLKNQEEFEYNWLNNSVKKELRNLIKNEKNYLKKYHNIIYKINNFLNSTSFSLYISNNQNKKFIRISNFGFSYNQIREKNFKDTLENLRFNFIEKLNLKDNFYNLNSKSFDFKDYSYVKSLIKSPNKLRSYESLKGLNTLNTKNGATKWDIFSSSNKFYKKYFNAYYNSFCSIDIKEKLKDSTISVYNKDSKILSDFSKYKTYNIVNCKIIESEDIFLIKNNKNNIKKLDLETLLLDIKNLSERVVSLENKLNNYLSKLKKATFSPKIIRPLNE